MELCLAASSSENFELVISMGIYQTFTCTYLSVLFKSKDLGGHANVNKQFACNPCVSRRDHLCPTGLGCTMSQNMSSNLKPGRFAMMLRWKASRNEMLCRR